MVPESSQMMGGKTCVFGSTVWAYLGVLFSALILAALPLTLKVLDLV
jgi:hypothetical protein